MAERFASHAVCVNKWVTILCRDRSRAEINAHSDTPRNGFIQYILCILPAAIAGGGAYPRMRAGHKESYAFEVHGVVTAEPPPNKPMGEIRERTAFAERRHRHQTYDDSPSCLREFFSNRLAHGGDFGNGYNWLNRDLPHFAETGSDTVMAVCGIRSTNWFDVINDDYIGRYGTQPLLANFGYLSFSGTTTVQQRTITWPIVPADQNGSGLAESRVEKFDQLGNQVSLLDERVVVTNFTIDVVTGAQLQRVDDATDMAFDTN